MQTVLIATSIEPLEKQLCHHLRSKYEVFSCCNGATAISQLNHLKPDILVIDLQLPFINGLSVLQRSCHKPGIILALTSYANEEILQIAGNMGIASVILLPNTTDVIMSTLDTLIKEKALPRSTTRRGDNI